ncbi:Uncharacterised protein [Streptococcus pneumoniae]|nr:Uncharacterised protein [Streptococcus pneumoniae]
MLTRLEKEGYIVRKQDWKRKKNYRKSNFFYIIN